MSRAKGPVVQSTPPPAVIDCKLQSSGPITVGQKLVLSCPTQGTMATSVSGVKFTNQDPSAPFTLEFLGNPEVKGDAFVQSVTSYKVGAHSFDKVILTVDGKIFHLNPFRIDVSTVIQAPSQQAPAPQPGQEGQEQGQTQQPTPYPIFDPEKVPAPWWWWAIWLTLAALILLFFTWQIVKWLKDRKKIQAQTPERKLTPREQFQARLRKLESRDFHQKGEFKAFALELTNILKTTIGGYLGFGAEDMTSEEVLANLERRYKVFFTATGQTLTETFAELDQIKFAKIETSSARCMALLDNSMKIGRGLFGDQP